MGKKLVLLLLFEILLVKGYLNIIITHNILNFIYNFFSLFLVYRKNIIIGRNWASNNMVEYMNIESFEYKTRIWGSIQRAMELIGMKFPV